MTTITTDVYLKISNESTWQQDDFLRAKKKGDHAGMVSAGYVSAYPASDGYTLLGKGTATIELLDDKEVTKSAVASLTARRKRVLAEAQAEATKIEGQIQNLLAIEFTTA